MQPIQFQNTMVIKATILIAVMALMLAMTEPAAAQDVARHPVNVSLFYPLSTNQDPGVMTNVRLNLLYGRVGYIRGFDIGTIVNRTDRDMRGIQLTGVFSHIGNESSGLIATGVVNYAGADVRGIQLAGFVNFVRDRVDGLQYASLFNFVQEEFHGVQLTALFNLNGGNAGFFQYGTFGNLTGGDFTGVQLSSGINYVNEFLSGAQFGGLNVAAEFNGFQVGGANVAGAADGAMIGIVNYAKELDGIPVGVINFERTSGQADWSIYASNLALANTGLRTIVHGFVSTLSVGIDDIQEKRSDTAFLSWHYGYLFSLGTRFWLSPDVGFVHIMPQSSEAGKNNDLHFAVQARLTGEVKVTSVLKIFAGGGVSTVFSEYSSDASTETDPLIVGGVQLY